MLTASVWIVLHHVAREDTDDEEVKLLGVYSSVQAADAAVARMKILPGFREYPDGFYVDEYRLDEDHWTTGFVRVR